jgi:hypothetical protein
MAELVYTSRYYPTLLAERLVNIVLAIVELLLALRFVLELLGANMRGHRSSRGSIARALAWSRRSKARFPRFF